VEATGPHRSRVCLHRSRVCVHPGVWSPASRPETLDGWARSVGSGLVLAIFQYSTTGYKILGLLHILAVIVAFGPLFLYPALQRAGQTQSIARMHLLM